MKKQDGQTVKRFMEYRATLPALVLACGLAQAQTDQTPDFSVTTDSGKRISPTAFGGSLLVLNFWETACVPCVKELPSLSEFARKFRSERVVGAIDWMSDDIASFVRNPKAADAHEGDRKAYDEIYSNGSAMFRAEPNVFMMRTIAGRTPGRALDVAMGLGRNALWLASQ